MPKLEQFEIKKYWQIFSGLKPADNKVNHDQVLPILYNSKLDSSVLNQIWFLADIDDDDNLDFEEFVICMRLIFDMVNKNIDKVPDELPDWLVPGSKASLIKERKQRKQQENADLPKQETPEVDWYMSPEDVTQYEKMLGTCERSRDGTVTFPSLSWMVKSKFFNIGPSDMDKVWNLVNPRNLSSIDKDPAFYFIHCLRQCNDVGARIPSELPKALADICNKERVSYDLKSAQADVKKIVKNDETKADTTPRNDTSALDAPVDTITDVDALEKELALLDAELSRAKANNESTAAQNTARQLREQFEGLLKYRQHQTLEHSKKGHISIPINSRAVAEDLDNIEEQVNALESYLRNKQSELQSLEREIASFR
ncbi:hypothetical protein HG536_0B02650 [Torulaspora globosa]|uniref:Actin cytoskeleton-regulatory complex protein END3 n=1 Tax=Torulaspora globosa TaxID=48254 RepID=A0A7G3ZD16_9SACH|nr:uncharacterized protein HG536_0B02650 [Torulaspora globosa]QLL31402.1 hypothetical protein HG536_0B02650 [Torulaspora globosa]